MNAGSAVAPVVFMLALGFLARKKSILSEEQNAGVKKLIFSILLPILVFNATFTMSVDAKYVGISLSMFLLQCVTLALGFLLFRLLKVSYAHLSPWLMTTIEGGNAFYPLYISLVGTGYASYFVLLDVPGIFMIFLVIPLLLAHKNGSGTSRRDMLRSIFANPIVCALAAGLFLNLTGLSGRFMATSVYPVYETLASVATAPIAPLILFTLGYSLRIRREYLSPMLKTLAVRLGLMACGALLLFAVFPWIAADLPPEDRRNPLPRLSSGLCCAHHPGRSLPGRRRR